MGGWVVGASAALSRSQRDGLRSALCCPGWPAVGPEPAHRACTLTLPRAAAPGLQLVDDSQSLFEKRLHASNLKAQAARAISGSLGAVAKTRSGGRAAGGLAGLRQALAQQEDAAAEQEARRRREQQRQQQEERRRQQQEALQQEQQQQQAEAEQQPGEPP